MERTTPSLSDDLRHAALEAMGADTMILVEGTSDKIALDAVGTLVDRGLSVSTV